MKKEKKKGNLLLLIIKIGFIFLITDFIVSNVPAMMTRAVNTGKYGLSFIVEMFAALVVFIVMLLSKNQYVFTEKKEGFFKSIILGLPILIIAIAVFLVNIPSIFEPALNLSNLITLILFCISIGLYEEFLCRGWLLNEFLEKYGSTRKQVITSIFISATIFGLMHISNIWIGGQTVTQTIMQVIQATAVGVLFGTVYYRSKNIWAVVFLHGFYDFALFLGTVNTLKECHAVSETLTAISVIGTISLSLVYLLTSAILLRKSKINHMIKDEKELTKQEKTKSDRMVIVYVILIFAAFTIPAPEDTTEVEEICYEYKEKRLYEIEFHYSNYNDYTIEEEHVYNEMVDTVSPEDPTQHIPVQVEKREPVNISFVAKGNKLNVKLNGYEDTIKFEDPIQILVLEQPEDYLVFIHEQDQQSGASKIHFSRYFTKGSIIPTEEYIKGFGKSLNEEYVPDVVRVGYVTSRDFEYKYPILNVGTSNYLFLNEKNELFLIK
jgi:membrane protease YdiL (CAAX protease family)